MLEDIDDDYFTPATSTTLSKIFTSNYDKGTTENDSLKYTPTSQNTLPKSEEDTKTTECIFACVLLAYEWSHNNYTSKGKLGFAILRGIKTKTHNIVLYNSNRSTISTVTITPKLEVTVKGKLYVCYYDNMSKYWSIFAKGEEIDKIIKILKSLNVTLKHSPCNDQSPPEPGIEESHKNVTAECSKDYESDTDSTINRRTKESILSRMASMGQSVLPKHALPTEKTSDSSDTNETNSETKIVRHKPVKAILKRMNTNETKNVPETHSIVETHKFEQYAEASPMYTIINGQLVPVTNTSFIGNANVDNVSKDLNLLISEQRVSNSEIRININRATDKLDQIMEKIKVVPPTDENNSKFQIEILSKLLSEYENKIKIYEDIMKFKNMDLNSQILAKSVGDKPSEVDLLKNKIAVLDKMLEDKDNEIVQLNQKIDINAKLYAEYDKRNETELLKEIEDLKEAQNLKNKELLNMSKEIEKMTLKNNYSIDFENKLKIIMNDMFQSISVNFDNNEHYSGENVKNTVAAIIKKFTIESLKK